MKMLRLKSRSRQNNKARLQSVKFTQLIHSNKNRMKVWSRLIECSWVGSDCLESLQVNT